MSFTGLTATALALSRGGRRLFAGLSFELHAGEALLLLGPNGSGKSSLLRALVGLTPLASGTLALGRPPVPLRPRELCRAALYQGHAASAKAEFTAGENLALACELDGSHADPQALATALERVGLARHRDIETRRLSQGQKQRLQLARFAVAAAGAGRRLWLMDEPSAALDRQGGELLQSLLAGHLAAGGAAIIATHLPITAAGAAVRELRLDAFRPARLAEAA